jgi:hypothetical protein
VSHIDGRDELLDWTWLERVYKRDGMHGLSLRLRNGAEELGGTVTAVADAVTSPGPEHYLRLKDGCDLHFDASLKIMRGTLESGARGSPLAYACGLRVDRDVSEEAGAGHGSGGRRVFGPGFGDTAATCRPSPRPGCRVRDRGAHERHLGV